MRVSPCLVYRLLILHSGIIVVIDHTLASRSFYALFRHDIRSSISHATVPCCYHRVLDCFAGVLLVPPSYFRRLLDNSRIRQLADWASRGCQRRLCVLSFRSFGGICETSSCLVRDLSSPRDVQSASWRIRELSSYPFDVSAGYLVTYNLCESLSAVEQRNRIISERFYSNRVVFLKINIADCLSKTRFAKCVR